MLNNEQLMTLPVPTPEQTARFADHVVDDHLRYKPLPFYPLGATFVFFPDPHAGHEIWRRGKKFLISRVVPEASASGQSQAQPSTEEYLDRFGHWNYWVNESPFVDKPKPGPWLHCAETGNREPLADHLKQRWSCRLTAFLKPSPLMLLNREAALKKETTSFEYRSSPRRMEMVREIIERQTKKPASSEDPPIIARYRFLVRLVRGGLNNLYGPEAMRFMETEALEQRQALLKALERIRTDWSRSNWTLRAPSPTDI